MTLVIMILIWLIFVLFNKIKELKRQNSFEHQKLNKNQKVLANELNKFMKNVKTIIAIGECRERVGEYARSIGKEVFVYEHLADGFDKASEIAEEGDVVLLSPASASWDQYKECEVRGAEFKDKVKDLLK